MNRFKTIVEIESQKNIIKSYIKSLKKNMKLKQFNPPNKKSLEHLIYVILMMLKLLF